MLRCILHPGCGRLVVAARHIEAGEVIFAEEAYAVAPNVDSPKNKIFCIFCAAPITQAFARCGQCASAYCSSVCHEIHVKAHEESGECAALLFCQHIRSKIDGEDLDTFQMTALVIAHCVAEGSSALLERLPTDPARYCAKDCAVETVGLGQETESPLVFLNDHSHVSSEQPRKSTYAHFESLVTNVHDIRADVLSDFDHLYDIYQHGTRAKKIMTRLNGMERFLPSKVSRETFVSICCAFLCNGFGIWDSKNRKQATAMYTDSSYFNHSCAPNLGRRNLKHSRVMEFFAARPIREGEQLCISYVDVKLPAAERIAKLIGTYTFTCCCPRCAPDADPLLADTTIGDAVPPLCEFCSSRVLQPLPDGTYQCPCCEKVQIPEGAPSHS